MYIYIYILDIYIYISNTNFYSPAFLFNMRKRYVSYVASGTKIYYLLQGNQVRKLEGEQGQVSLVFFSKFKKVP